MSLVDPIDDRYRAGVRVNAWLHVEHTSTAATRRQLLRALGIRGRKSYPVQARAKGESLVVRMDAHYSPFERQSRGALRSYLERADAQAPGQRMVYVNGLGHPDNVLQNAPLEQWLDRWSIWINPSEHDVSPWTAMHALNEELGRRFGLAEEDVYIVQHHEPGAPERWHLHAVVPATSKTRGADGTLVVREVKLERETMREIGQRMVRALVLERAVEHALDPTRRRPAENGWDLPATERQVGVLRRAGRPAAGLTRGEASLSIEAMGWELSWMHDRDRGR